MGNLRKAFDLLIDILQFRLDDGASGRNRVVEGLSSPRALPRWGRNATRTLLLTVPPSTRANRFITPNIALGGGFFFSSSSRSWDICNAAKSETPFDRAQEFWGQPEKRK